MTKFWIVWNPQGKSPPSVKFDSFELAKQAAEKMAGWHPGNVFHVMGMEGTAKRVDVVWEPVAEEMPF